MRDNQSTTASKNTELEAINFSDIFPATMESREDHVSIVHLWRVLQKRRWLVLGSLATSFYSSRLSRLRFPSATMRPHGCFWTSKVQRI
jgi:hypothetical protein